MKQSALVSVQGFTIASARRRSDAQPLGVREQRGGGAPFIFLPPVVRFVQRPTPYPVGPRIARLEPADQRIDTSHVYRCARVIKITPCGGDVQPNAKIDHGLGRYYIVVSPHHCVGPAYLADQLLTVNNRARAHAICVERGKRHGLASTGWHNRQHVLCPAVPLGADVVDQLCLVWSECECHALLLAAPDTVVKGNYRY